MNLREAQKCLPLKIVILIDTVFKHIIVIKQINLDRLSFYQLCLIELH